VETADEQATGDQPRHLRDFYAGDEMSQALRAKLSATGEGDSAEAAMEITLSRLVEALNRCPDDVPLLLQSTQTLARMFAAQNRPSGSARKQLAANFQAVLDGFGDQLLPPDYEPQRVNPAPPPSPADPDPPTRSS